MKKIMSKMPKEFNGWENLTFYYYNMVEFFLQVGIIIEFGYSYSEEKYFTKVYSNKEEKIESELLLLSSDDPYHTDRIECYKIGINKAIKIYEQKK